MMSNDSQDAPGRGMSIDRVGATGPTIRLDGAAGRLRSPATRAAGGQPPAGRMGGRADGFGWSAPGGWAWS